MDPEPKLLDRDKLLRDSFTPAEYMLFGLILITANVSFWLADPRSNWLLGFFLIGAAMIIVVLKTHERTHPFFISSLWSKICLYTAPVWLLLLQFSVGLLQRPLETITLKGTEFIQLEKPQNIWLPISTSADSAWLPVLGFGAIYIITIGLFIVPKSRFYFERLMPCLCLSAVLVALFGYVQTALNTSKPLLTKGTGAEDYFGFFPYDGHWAAFAVLWTCACISMALLTTRYEDKPAFIHSSGPWYLTGGTLLGASAFMVDAKWPAAILILVYATMMMLFAVNFFAASKDPNRKSITLFSGLISLGMLLAGVERVFQSRSQPELVGHLNQAALEMFRDSPLFGWGMDSFGAIMPFYANDLLLANRYERAGCDALQILAELGIIGVFPAVLLLAYLIIRYLNKRHNIMLTNHLLIGLAAILLLAFLDSPFMSPAVFLSFFALLFIALRWADITRNKFDEIDVGRPNLVTSPRLRRVPFHIESKSKKRKK